MAQTLQLQLTVPINTPRTTGLKKQWFASPSLFKATTRFNDVPITQSKRSPLLAAPIVCSAGGNAATTGKTAVKPPQPIITPAPDVDIRRSYFPPPPEFIFGAASAAYQIEGAWDADGKGPSLWDWYSQKHSDRIDDGSNGNVATDSYHRYKDDIKLMKDLGCETYRFSVSWPRILPDGTLKGGINPKGIEYYNNLINECLKNGIKPFVTIFHWDVPQALQEKYGGFLSKDIVEDFKDFAKVCFDSFGDRVKHWITLNEPWTFAVSGYCLGWHAPGRGSPAVGALEGNSATECYQITHNFILAHAAAATLYKSEYQAKQGGEIGITLVSMWLKPFTSSYFDVEARDRAMDFMLGWYMQPLAFGDYPFSMRSLVRDRLPKFTEDEKKMIKGSYDFIGLNYYTSKFVQEAPIVGLDDKPGYYTYFDDFGADLKVTGPDGTPIGELHGSWIYVVPDGIKELMNHMKVKYGNPHIYITENGTCQVEDLSFEEAINDDMRSDYLANHLHELRVAMESGVNIKGYFTWSITDNYEWQHGYRERFGLIYIDYNDDLKRIPKKSYNWYKTFLRT